MKQRPSVSVLMPCLNAGPFLAEAAASALHQPDCLELLVADGGSSDGSLQLLNDLVATDPRVRVVSRSDHGPADALNKAYCAARGTLIGWLNADDLYTPGALARAKSALDEHPEWLMLYGDGEEFDTVTGLINHYPTLPASVGLEGFRSHCFICQPTVLFRRTMPLLLGPFADRWHTAFDFDYWLRAFAAFPNRIGYIPHLQGRTRLHPGTITNQQRALVALEATALLARHFGSAPATRLHSYGLELQMGLAQTPSGLSFQEHLGQLAEQAADWISPTQLAAFKCDWLYQPDEASKHPTADRKLVGQLPIRLLNAIHPELGLHKDQPPALLQRHLHEAVQKYTIIYPLLPKLTGNLGKNPPTPDLNHGSSQPFVERPFGVNLIGHAFEIFGIGEDIRMAACALQAAGVPCAVIHQPAANGSACTDRSLEPFLCSDPSGGPYAFNLVCMAAPSHARWLLQAGFDALRERFTLTAWPWETQQWPKAWLPLLEVADELWPSSSFTAAALQEPAAGAVLPLQVMPMAAAIPDPDRFCNPAARQAARSRHDLPADDVLFGYSFDLNSTAIRKNPMGALESFQLAFPLPELPSSFGRECNRHPLSNHVALMIKTFPPQGHSIEWLRLQLRAAEDPRIHLVVASLERDELLDLYGCCDVFLSLHRSEGFGRGIAEALQLGLDVICTAYGGNVDFCTGPLAHPVRFQTVPIPRGAYPCADGHLWAEPDLAHAAALMQEVAARRRDLELDPAAAAVDPSRDADVLAAYRERFSYATTGLRYKARLEALWSQRHALATQLKWNVVTPA
jgi:hypothetical protein